MSGNGDGKKSSSASAKDAGSKVATKSQFMTLATKGLVRVEEFYVPELDCVVKIAPAKLADYHRILAQLQDVALDPEQSAKWELAWVVACLVEPEITPEDAPKLLEARTPTITRLANRCAAISGFGAMDEAEARIPPEEDDSEPGEGTPLG